MINHAYLAAGLIAGSVLASAEPASAAGETLITHAKALAGNVTPGDAAGYPVTISIPGKFQLASNLFVAADKIGIQVTSAYVTIDLNGFLMQGSNVAWYGITGGVESVVVTNGTIAKFKFDGINSTGEDWLFEGLRISQNGRDGIVCGPRTQVRDNTITRQGRNGINCVAGLIEGNVADVNAAWGISVTNGAIINNAVNANGAGGVTLTRGLVAGNEVTNNTGIGIGTSLGSVSGNAILGNTGFGVYGGATGVSALGGNTLFSNNGGNQQIGGLAVKMEPDACVPDCQYAP